jgi:hypothetical protein
MIKIGGSSALVGAPYSYSGVNVSESSLRCRNCHYWEQKEGDDTDGWCMRALAKAYASYTCPLFNHCTLPREDWDK